MYLISMKSILTLTSLINIILQIKHFISHCINLISLKLFYGDKLYLRVII